MFPQTEVIYEALNQAILDHVPKTAERILDLGCGTGALGRRIKEERNCQVIGVTSSDAEAKQAAKWLDEVVVCDLNNYIPAEPGSFDCVICSHILEHLYQPDDVLKQLRRALASEGTLIVALPNVLHWRQRLKFLSGDFKYTDGGLMDRTHYRFFDWDTARDLLTDTGYSLTGAHAYGGFPLSRYLFLVGERLNSAALRVFPGLFGFQFVLVCRANHN